MSALYNHAKESFLSQNPSIDMDTDTIKLALVDLTADYTFSATHQYLNSVTTYAGTTDQTLGSITITSGVFNAGTATFTAVSQSSTKTVGALVIYKSTGVSTTSPLIAYITGFTAVTPNGGNIVVTWDSGANKIFAL